MSNFHIPIREGFGRYLERFHAQIVGDTKFVAEFAARPFAKAAVWAPGRMVDKVEDMLDSWRKNDTSQADKPTPFLPLMIAAMTYDYLPVTPDYSRQVADPVNVMIPGDAKNRVFQMRAAISEHRIQVAIAGPDVATCNSIAMQLQLFCTAMGNRRFYSTYRLAGSNEQWPASLENPDIGSVVVPGDVKNLVVLVADITIRASVPLLKHPKSTDADADGKGTDDGDDPDGYLCVQEVIGSAYPDVPGSTPQVWHVP